MTQTSSEATTEGPWSVRRAMGGGKYHHITSAARDHIAVFASADDADLVVSLVNDRPTESACALVSLLREICDQSDARVARAGVREPEAEALYLRARAAIAAATR